MRLYIIRHAWAEDPDDRRWPDDSARPLTSDGIKRFRCVAEKLGERGCRPTLIASSPYVRAWQTAELLVKHLGCDPRLARLDALECGSDLAAALAWTAEQDADELAWVGHMPDVALCVARLIGDGTAQIEFAKGAIAALDFPARPALGLGVLRWFATAKVLGC